MAASQVERRGEAAVAPLTLVLKRQGNDPIAVDAAVSGLKGREAAVLVSLVADKPSQDAVEMLAGAAGKSRNVAQVKQVIALATDDAQATYRSALLNGLNTGLIGADARRFGSNVAGGKAGGGIVDTMRRTGPVEKPLDLPEAPVALTKLASGT